MKNHMRMQELNNASKLETTLSTDTESCNHQPVYFGVVNINIDERTIGSVDVWRCVLCKKRFCEEKQLGIEELAGRKQDILQHTRRRRHW